MPPRTSQFAVCATNASCVAAVMTGTPARIVSQCQTSNGGGRGTRREARAQRVGVGRRRDDDEAWTGKPERRSPMSDRPNVERRRRRAERRAQRRGRRRVRRRRAARSSPKRRSR